MSERPACPAGDGGRMVRNSINGPVEYSCGHGWSMGEIVSGPQSAQTWPDGQPVTPWADPWHDVAADVRDVYRSIGQGLTAADLASPPCPEHGLPGCLWCPA
jgi:hypothetical protein